MHLRNPALVLFLGLAVVCGRADGQPGDGSVRGEQRKIEKKLQRALERSDAQGLRAADGRVLAKARPYFRMESKGITAVELQSRILAETTMVLQARDGILKSTQGVSGPWGAGYGFANITLRLQGSFPAAAASGTGPASVYYNGFFADNPDRDIYQHYFGNVNLPATTTPSQKSGPGDHISLQSGTSTAVVEMFLTLESIANTERFGGSFALTFAQSEEDGFEIQEGNKLWDVSGLKLTVHVLPVFKNGAQPNERIYFFNPGAQETMSFEQARRAVAADLSVARAMAYEITTIGSKEVVRRLPEDGLASLAPVLGWSLTQFVHAFLHTQNKGRFDGNDDRVERIIVNEDELQLITRQRQTYLRFCGQVGHFQLDTINLGSSSASFGVPYFNDARTIEVTARTTVYGSQLSVYGSNLHDDLEPGGETRFFHITTFPLTQCAEFERADIIVNLRSREPMLPDVNLGTTVNTLTISCDTVRALDQETPWSPDLTRVLSQTWLEEQNIDDPSYWTQEQLFASFTQLRATLELIRM